MSDPAEQIAVLQDCCPGATLLDDSGGKVAYLPDFEFTHLGEAKKLDLLLIPFAHSGYDIRLFFSEQLKIAPGKTPPVWTLQTACGRTWHAPSVRQISSAWTWREMITAFLRTIG